jgi:hypothetical protein
MAGIKVEQYKIFKIESIRFRNSDWNLTISKKRAMELNEIVSLFDSQLFELIRNILIDNGLEDSVNNIDYTKYLMSLVISKDNTKNDFYRACDGFVLNGITFKRFVGTTGGLKANSVLFVNEKILDELNSRCECGRNVKLKVVPAKYEAYKALTCSASQKICNPKNILVVKDCLINIKGNVIDIDDSQVDKENLEPIVTEKLVDIENNISDGFNLCTIDFMKKIKNYLGLDSTPNGVCIRNAYCKGMLYPFPIEEFCKEKNNGNYFVKDIWGNDIDIRNVDMILTESSLKFWDSYKSGEDYLNKCQENGYNFRITKIVTDEIEDTRELNYQYLQSYNFSKEDIIELCKNTVEYLKNSMCGDYEQTLKFLGVDEQSKDDNWQKALFTNEYMMNDPYIIDCIHRLIKKKIDNAKIGKLIIKANYQQASGDPFALMQSICGLEVTGLLKANECYSSYWNNLADKEWSDKDNKEILAFRSPMITHNNIRKCKIVNNEEVNKWYKYMKNIFIINGFDTFCIAESGEDFDADANYTTNDKTMIKNYVNLPAIQCIQRKAKKMKIDLSEKNGIARIQKSNLNGFGNQVGTITNYATSMMDIKAMLSDKEKIKEIDKRILCTQLYQQNELDKIKGIVATNMPKYWYNIKGCKKASIDEEIFNESKFYYLESLCCDKKPYFMIYRYKKEKNNYIKFLTDANNKCIQLFGISLENLLSKKEFNESEKSFIKWYNVKMPITLGNCTMNKICRYIENQFDGLKIQLKSNRNFDYTILKTNHRCTNEHKMQIEDLCKKYVNRIAIYKATEENENTDIESKVKISKQTISYFKDLIIDICPNDDERLDIVLDLCYGKNSNKKFCWDMVGDLIIKRLEELKNEQ